MSWYVAPSIQVALNEANRLWPNREKESDGTIGDAAHAATDSDHNPDYRGCIHAFDITARGPVYHRLDTPDGDALVARLVEKRDARVAYLIWNHGIWRAYNHPGVPAWTRASYSGSSPHEDHVHVSIWSDLNTREGLGYDDQTLRDSAEQNTSPWWTPSQPAPAPIEEEDVPSLTPGQPPVMLPVTGSANRLTLATDGGCTLRLAALKDGDVAAFTPSFTLGDRHKRSWSLPAGTTHVRCDIVSTAGGPVAVYLE